MSQNAAQKPKSNLMNTILLFAVVFLASQMLCPKPTNNDPRTADQVMGAIQKQSDLIKQQSASQGRSVSAILTEMKTAGTDLEFLKPSDKLSPAQDLQQLHILNGMVCDISSPFVEQAYESAINKTIGLSKQQKDEAAVQSQLLVADTQLKAAKERSEIQRITLANDTVVRLAHNNDKKPIWNQPIPVAPTKDYPATAVTPKQITDQVDSLSGYLGKSTPVWGFIPGYQAVDALIRVTGSIPGFSYWFGCLLLAVIVRLVVWPLTQKQMMWSRQISQLTPLIKEIKEEYKNDQVEMNAKTMALYKEYGMNPMAGCFPMFFQLPLFYMVYQSMLHYRFEFQQGTFAWINPSMSAATHGFIARNLGEKDYILIVLYGISMITTAFLAPVSDPSNIKQQRMMGVSMSAFFGIMMFFWPVPSAFILYWTFTNVLATSQSLRAYRLPLPPLVKKNAPNGGVFPTGGSKFGVTKEGLPTSSTNGKLNGKPKSTGAPKIHKPKKKK
jgi:YidC/Oxa1 family membrane protein insertase